MAERAKKVGRVKLVQEQQRTEQVQNKVGDSGKEEVISTPEGYRFSEEVTSTPSDVFVAEDAPKARVEGQVVSPPAIDLSPDSLQLANLCLGISNSLVVVMFGQECALYDGEKKLLYPSLSRVINRMPAASAGKAAVFIDPLVLLFGLAVWANRIISIKSQQRNTANAVTAREFATASGISWDTRPGQQGPEQQPIRPPGNGDQPVVPKVGPDSINANGVIGKVPDAIIDSRTDDITGPG